MAMLWRVALVGCLIALLVLETIDAKGGKGGGGRGGRGGGKGGRGGSRSGLSWGGSSRSGSRVTSRFGSLSGARSYKGAMYESSYWGTASSIGVLYGLSSYKRRKLYRDSPNKEPTICFNDVQLKNVTYGFFICPEPDQSDDYTYCCGDDGNQECCDEEETTPMNPGFIILICWLGLEAIMFVVWAMSRLWYHVPTCPDTSSDTFSENTPEPSVQYTTASGSGGIVYEEFVCRIKGALEVWGPGLKNGVFSEYQGSFYVDALRAGGGQLDVSVTGLKGTVRVEMQRVRQNDNLFNCLYHPVEPGVYTINVQWSGNHVAGSPYTIFVASNVKELEYY